MVHCVCLEAKGEMPIDIGKDAGQCGLGTYVVE